MTHRWNDSSINSKNSPEAEALEDQPGVEQSLGVGSRYRPLAL